MDDIFILIELKKKRNNTGLEALALDFVWDNSQAQCRGMGTFSATCLTLFCWTCGLQYVCSRTVTRPKSRASHFINANSVVENNLSRESPEHMCMQTCSPLVDPRMDTKFWPRRPDTAHQKFNHKGPWLPVPIFRNSCELIFLGSAPSGPAILCPSTWREISYSLESIASESQNFGRRLVQNDIFSLPPGTLSW